MTKYWKNNLAIWSHWDPEPLNIIFGPPTAHSKYRKWLYPLPLPGFASGTSGLGNDRSGNCAIAIVPPFMHKLSDRYEETPVTNIPQCLQILYIFSLPITLKWSNQQSANSSTSCLDYYYWPAKIGLNFIFEMLQRDVKQRELKLDILIETFVTFGTNSWRQPPFVIFFL